MGGRTQPANLARHMDTTITQSSQPKSDWATGRCPSGRGRIAATDQGASSSAGSAGNVATRPIVASANIRSTLASITHSFAESWKERRFPQPPLTGLITPSPRLVMQSTPPTYTSFSSFSAPLPTIFGYINCLPYLPSETRAVIPSCQSQPPLPTWSPPLPPHLREAVWDATRDGLGLVEHSVWTHVQDLVATGLLPGSDACTE